jgi:ATP-binding cassette subfamily C protein LapB
VKTFRVTLARLAQLQAEAVDRIALNEAATAAEQDPDPRGQLVIVCRHLQVKGARWLKSPDASAVPALLHHPERGWGLLRGLNSQGQWVAEWLEAESQKWAEVTLDQPTLAASQFARLRLSKPFEASRSPMLRLIMQELLANKRMLLDAALGGVVINLIAMATSFFSMQVYDRVVPTGATQTLLVLTLGVVFAISFELVAKRVRSGLYERLIDQVDQRLARAVYMRFLSIRLDQIPSSVGALASQMRGYESVRAFLTTITSQLLVDAPFALMFLALIGLISGTLALIPAAFFVCSVMVGLYYLRRVEAFAAKATAAGNRKTGLLVEAVEGAETIKSGQGGWRMLQQWMQTTDEARDYEMQSRAIQEHAQYLMGAFQQISYVLLVASGALLVSKGEISMGALIACSILSGRVLTPAGMIPNQLVQWANTKAALVGLDRLWTLQDDHHGINQPLVPHSVQGRYRFDEVSSAYGGNKALDIKALSINPGEKIGVIGPIGGGKTTFLRLLSGMYKPQGGRILLDDMELSHISKPVLAEKIGYLQQDGRLFAGTLRDNLVLGLLDPGDSAILEAARRTGLLEAVVTAHPKGLQQEIFEGGTGLSGGQRQLVNLTRVFLREPAIWLLDEPTASMDRNLELQVTEALKQSLHRHNTLVLVTHKIELLELVDRVIVIANHQVVMDGPKHQVLARLHAPPPKPQQSQQQPQPGPATNPASSPSNPPRLARPAPRTAPGTVSATAFTTIPHGENV